MTDTRNESIEDVPVRILPDGRMTRKESAKYLGYSEKTLAMWKMNGKGPRWIRVGGRIFHYRNDLDDFIRHGDSKASKNGGAT